jgi:hypothetical protein
MQGDRSPAARFRAWIHSEPAYIAELEKRAKRHGLSVMSEIPLLLTTSKSMIYREDDALDDDNALVARHLHPHQARAVLDLIDYCVARAQKEGES